MSDRYFENQTPINTDEDKIRSNPCYYISIVEQTEENCLLACSLRFDALRYIPKALHTEEMCIVAVKQCGYALKYASKRIINEEICFEAIRAGCKKHRFAPQGYNVFDYIPMQYITLEFCTRAYDENPDIYPYIPMEFRKSLEVKVKDSANEQKLSAIERVSSDGLALKYIPSRSKTKLVCTTAVKNNPYALAFVPERFKTPELCKSALSGNLMSISFFPEEYITLDLIKEWLENVINAVNRRVIEIEKEFDKRRAEYYYSDIIARLISIISKFPQKINSNRDVIRLQRQLGVRKFETKMYNKKIKKFKTSEKIFDSYENVERYFSDFTKFYNHVHGDLSNADLHDFDFVGVDLSNINIDGAYISSDVLAERGLYDNRFYNSLIPIDKTKMIPLTEIVNETVDAQSIIHVDDIGNAKLNSTDINFYYISDIHIMHKLMKNFPLRATYREIEAYVKSIVSDLANSCEELSSDDYLLVGGDISFNFEVSKIFYTALAEHFEYCKIIAVLGNHELWDAQYNNESMELQCSVDSLSETIEKYRNMFDKLGIHLLHNQLLVLENNRLRISTEEQLINISEQRLKDIALGSPFVLLGGLGFSGYEKEHNATCGLYRNKVMTLHDDLTETKKFEVLYSKLKQCIPKEKAIIFTHTPKSNWSEDGYNKNWIYVSGHTHKNEYTDDGEKTVYADNQVGYKSTSFGLKYFNISSAYDIFKYYDDGRYVIKKSQYNEFNRCAKILCTYNRSGGTIHMLKKQNNYCFFYEENNKLYMLNGGAIKTAKHQNLDYYFERLDIYSDAVKDMLFKYNSALRQISNEVKKFGGDGNIHGCIVDIDYFSHIYLNPVDGSITPYFATDIVNKKVYTSVKSLLESNNLRLYSKYMKLISSESSMLALTVVESGIDTELAKNVFDTKMYQPSRIMKSLQYTTEANVVRNWSDDFISNIRRNLSVGQLSIK